ncbi:hypothetical protein LJC24_01035 [Desulfococcaceae bacterium OttesenSCG-928-F15]|nr:hypothetical protein [Desulfococcaceae bacterium OttesenSCG-928-F15]
MKKTALALFLSLLFLLTGCFENNVKTVKNSTFPGYETVKIGKILSSQFDKPSWKEFESDKGMVVVEFKGKISQNFHDRAVKYAVERIYVELSDAIFLDEGLKLQMMALRIDKLVKSFDPDIEKRLPPKLIEAGITKEAADIAPLWVVMDHTICITGEEITIQWVKQVTNGEFKLQHIGGEAVKNLESDDILNILYDEPLEYMNPAIPKIVAEQIRPLFENRKTILRVYKDVNPSKAISLPPKTEKAKKEKKGFFSRFGKKKASETIGIPADNLGTMEARIIEARGNNTLTGEWALTGSIQYGDTYAVRIAAPEAAEIRSPMGGDYLMLDYNPYGALVPSIGIGSGILSSAEEEMEFYGFLDFYNVYVDGKLAGRIEFEISPDLSGRFIYFKYKTCRTISNIYAEMKQGRQIKFVSDDKKKQFLFDINGLEKIEKQVAEALKDLPRD